MKNEECGGWLDRQNGGGMAAKGGKRAQELSSAGATGEQNWNRRQQRARRTAGQTQNRCGTKSGAERSQENGVRKNQLWLDRKNEGGREEECRMRGIGLIATTGAGWPRKGAKGRKKSGPI